MLKCKYKCIEGEGRIFFKKELDKFAEKYLL